MSYLISELFACKANLIYEDDLFVSVERNYNAAVGVILARAKGKYLIIDNFSINAANLALVEIAKTVSQVGYWAVVIVSKKNRRKLKKVYPTCIIDKEIDPEKAAEGFFLSPKMLHNFYDSSYSDGEYYDIDYYPLMKMAYRDVVDIASRSPLAKELKDGWTFVKEIIYGTALKKESRTFESDLIKTTLRILYGRSDIVPKYVILGRNFESKVDLSKYEDRIVLYYNPGEFDILSIPYAKRPRKENYIEDLRKGNKNFVLPAGSTIAFGDFSEEDTQILKERSISLNGGA